MDRPRSGRCATKRPRRASRNVIALLSSARDQRNPNDRPAAAQRTPKQAFQVVFVAGVLILPAALTLRTVVHPGVLEISSDNPTPAGYTWSLLLFIIPIVALSGWFARRPDLGLARKSFWRTIAVLAPIGFLLDLLFGNAFFTFLNKHATLGIGVPAMGGPIPVEEFVFYLTGFMLVLLSYIWADEYWVSAYNIPDYRAEAKNIPRIAQFHFPSVILGAALIAAAVVYKKLLSSAPDGFPSYFTSPSRPSCPRRVSSTRPSHSSTGEPSALRFFSSC